MLDIANHEFVVNDDGQLALLVDELGVAVSEVPALAVSRSEATAYLNLGAELSYRILGIHPAMIDQLRQADKVLVIEMGESDVTRTYDAHVGLVQD